MRSTLTSDDVSDDSAVESDISSLTDGDTGSDGFEDGHSSPAPPRTVADKRPARTRVPSSRAVTSSSVEKRCATRRDRMLMRDWLQTQADRASIPGMHWYNEQRTMIQIPWKHGSRSGWTIDDCQLYRAWAQYTGKCSNSVDEPKRWKANFRCALNSLPDVQEVKRFSQARGKDPYKVYEFLGDDVPRKTTTKRRRRSRRDLAGHMDVDHVVDVALPSSCRTRLPSYVEQETAQSTDNDDEQLELLEETTVIDRTSTEPLASMEEVLSMSQQQPVAVNSYLDQPRLSTSISHNTIPTFVTEMGETLMNELDDTEILSAVGSLDSDQWSASSSAVSSDYFTDSHASQMFEDTLMIIQADTFIPSWSRTDVNYASCLLSADISTSDYTNLTCLTSL